MPVEVTSSPSTDHGSMARAQLERDAVDFDRADAGKRNSKNGASHARSNANPWSTRSCDDFGDVGGRVERKQEAVVQLGAPAHERAGVRLGGEPRDERTHEQRLHERHARVRRHLEAAQLEQAEPAPFRVRAEQLVDAQLGAVRAAGDVDEELAEQPVDEPTAARCRRPAAVLRSSSANAISSS